MIERWRFGTMDNDLNNLKFEDVDKALNKGMETPQTYEQIMEGKEVKSFETQTNEGDWYGREVTTGLDDGVKMVDSGTGKEMVLRVFEFKKDKRTQKEMQAKGISVTKQMLFEYHWPQIKSTIWGDGLIENRDVEPRVMINKGSYKIVVLCEPSLGPHGIRSTVIQKPTTLQEVFKKK